MILQLRAGKSGSVAVVEVECGDPLLRSRPPGAMWPTFRLMWAEVGAEITGPERIDWLRGSGA